MENATLFQQVAYIVGVSFMVFGIPSILAFTLTEYICKRVWSK